MPDQNAVDVRTLFERVRGHRDSLSLRHSKVQEEIINLREQQEMLRKVAELFRSLVDQEIGEAAKAVERLQTEGLKKIFYDQDLSLSTEVSIHRGKVSMGLVTSQRREDGSVVQGNSSQSFGASVSTIQSLLLRIIVLIRRGLRPVLILDESLNNLNPDYSYNTGLFLKALCEKLGLDILMVTHDESLYDTANKKYRVRETSRGAVFDEETGV